MGKFKGKIKVVWNDSHTWKITKRYDKNGKLFGIIYRGRNFQPVKDYRGLVTDNSGNTYIGSDVCKYCALVKYCRAFNPINDACEEYDELNMNWQ